jgi:hypothetical protein
MRDLRVDFFVNVWFLALAIALLALVRALFVLRGATIPP